MANYEISACGFLRCEASDIGFLADPIFPVAKVPVGFSPVLRTAALIVLRTAALIVRRSLARRSVAI
jgi:hypothetical protein